VKLAGLVLAAGTGRRLAPVTDSLPKPLLPVVDRTLLDRQIERVAGGGAERVCVNTHHRAADVHHHLGLVAPAAVARFEPRLTGPAGAVLRFADLLRACDAVIVASADVVLDGDLGDLVATHRAADAALTFGVVDSVGAHRFGVLELDREGLVRGAREKPDVPAHEAHPVSAGVYCLGPMAIAAIGRLRRRIATVDFARDLAPSLLAGGARVAGHRFDGYWRDVGTPASYLAVNRDALHGRIGLSAAPPGRAEPGWTPPFFVHPGATVGTGVRIEGPAVVGADARVGAGATIADAVVLPGAVVPPGATVVGGVVGVSAANGAATMPDRVLVAAGSR
jgi:mannose-1-phosphate guanylyltransferase